MAGSPSQCTGSGGSLSCVLASPGLNPAASGQLRGSFEVLDLHALGPSLQMHSPPSLPHTQPALHCRRSACSCPPPPTYTHTHIHTPAPRCRRLQLLDLLALGRRALLRRRKALERAVEPPPGILGALGQCVTLGRRNADTAVDLPDALLPRSELSADLRKSVDVCGGDECVGERGQG